MFLHGLESGPSGEKLDALKRIFSDHTTVSAPDCRKETLRSIYGEDFNVLEDRITEVMKTLTRPTFLIGSSIGGLAAALIATRNPVLVTGLVLCAPALHWSEAQDINVVCPVSIIHGLEDDVVPYRKSLEFAYDTRRLKKGSIITLPHDNHRLAGSSSLIAETARFMNN